MAVLKAFRDSTIQENNIVQTIASAAGTLSAIMFVLPGLVMVGWWTGFPYWLSVAVIANRRDPRRDVFGAAAPRARHRHRSSLPGRAWPRPRSSRSGPGVGGVEENRRGLRHDHLELARGGGLLDPGAHGLVASTRRRAFGSARARRGLDELVAALIGVGHLVGVDGWRAMFVGLMISWAFWCRITPRWPARSRPERASTNLSVTCSSNKVRFIGAGTIGVAAIWTLLQIIGPIIAGIRGASPPSGAQGRPRRGAAITERDIPIGIVTASILVSMIPIGLLLYAFASTNPIASSPTATIAISIVYILIAGVVIAAVCGYMAGLDRRLKQPDLGRRDPFRPRHCADPRLALSARDRRCIEVPRRLRSVRHRRYVRRSDDLEQQPPGPENRRAGRGDAVAAAGRAGARGHVRRRS